MTKQAKTDILMEALEAAILRALKGSEGKEFTDAIANGIKLAALKHRVAGNDDDGDYFAGADT